MLLFAFNILMRSVNCIYLRNSINKLNTTDTFDIIKTLAGHFNNHQNNSYKNNSAEIDHIQINLVKVYIITLKG